MGTSRPYYLISITYYVTYPWRFRLGISIWTELKKETCHIALFFFETTISSALLLRWGLEKECHIHHAAANYLQPKSTQIPHVKSRNQSLKNLMCVTNYPFVFSPLFSSFEFADQS